MTANQLRKLLADGIEFHRAGRLRDALARYERILAADPRQFDANHLAGLVALQEGRAGSAVTLLERAHAAAPAEAVCHMRLALALSAAGRNAEAEAGLQHLVKVHPKMHEAWDNLGNIQQRRGRIAESISSYRRSLIARPDYAAGWCNLGLALIFNNEPEEALECQNRALALDPRLGRAYRGRAIAWQHLHRIPEAVRDYEAAVGCDPRDFEARSYRLYALHNLDGVNRDQLYREHRAFGLAAGGPPRPPVAAEPRPGEAERRLRVAFLSPDLRTHSVAFFIEPILRHLDRARFEVVLYHDHIFEDATSERLRSLAVLWRNFVGQPPAAVAAQVRADAPDILVDLAGHSGLNRLPLLAERLAPVQITYLGYPDTTGLDALDYRFVDAITDVPGTAEACASETLVRFAPTAWAYAPPAEAPTPRPREGSGVIFGCCNKLAKVSDSTLRLWAGVLRELPEARLRLKTVGLERESVRARLVERLAGAGIDRGRVDLIGWIPTIGQHLEFYQGIDVALDTTPYTGTTTTCEALWMGVPVVTLLGDRHCARVSASLLAAAGFPEWVADSPETYVRIAADLGRRAAQRAELRVSLRERMANSILLDHAGQARRFGEALRACWRQRSAQPEPTPEAAVA